MLAEKLDAMYVRYSSNLRYISGYSGSNGMTYISADDAWFFTDFRYKTQSAAEVNNMNIVVPEGKDLVTAMKEAGCVRSGARVGFEGNMLSYGEVEKLKNWITTRLNWLDNNMVGNCGGEPPVELATGQKFLVYPNPASSEINILSAQAFKQVQVFDYTGRQVYIDATVFTKSTTINVSHYTKGIYILKITGVNGKTSIEKVIIN